MELHKPLANECLQPASDSCFTTALSSHRSSSHELNQVLAPHVKDTLTLDLSHYQHLHHITLKVASTAVLAGLRFRTSAKARAGWQHTHEVLLKLSGDINQEFDPDLIRSVTRIARTRDVERLLQLGGLEGIARHLHTHLTTGLSIDGPGAHCDQYQPDNLAFRKRVFGENAYPRRKGKTIWLFLWEAGNDTTLIILMICALLSLGFGLKTDGLKEGWYDGVSIAFAVILVVVVTALSNHKQSKQFQRLTKERDNFRVQVVRHCRRVAVPIFDVVVGDIVQLSIGDQVPADGLLVEGRSLAIDESSLTGESDYLLPTPGEQAFLWSGSKIQDGYGSMLVTAVGVNTEYGGMMALLSDNTNDQKTPLQARLTNTANFIGKVGLSVAILVLIILVVFYFTGHSSINGEAKFQVGQTNSTDVMDTLVHILSIAITIVVVAVPEGLPLAVTLTLAYSMRRMMGDNALVRKLAACETMGSATTICSDKTGTLTLNKMTVVKSWIAGKSHLSEQEDYFMSSLPNPLLSLLFQGIAQNSMGSVFVPSSFNLDSLSGKIKQTEVTGSPTEKALLWWGLKAGMSFQDTRAESTILQMETFNSTKKRAGVAVETINREILVHWKGAAEIILSMCNKWMDVENNVEIQRLISTEKRQELNAMIEDMAAQSLRCVALAFYDMTQECNSHLAPEWSLPEADLTLLAVVGIKDPCRPGVKAAVEAVKAAGVIVRMVTGDNIATAKAIAMECGILELSANQITVEGETFRGWTENERRQKLPDVVVVARALPSDKLLLVETLQSMGEVVAVTGDGTNDAPALHKADIGLSMGDEGTEVAKESSDIIILDDNFASIVKVVRWGRSVYFNIQKFLQFQLTVNVAALTVNFVAAVSSGDVPLTAVQLLWVNLIMDTLGALALATEPPTDELMKKPPVGRKEPLITYTMWRNLAFQAAYQVAILLTLQFKGVALLRLSNRSDASAINRTIIFNTFVLCQLFNEVNARQPYRRNIFYGILNNYLFMGIVATTILLQVVMVEFLEKFASTMRLDWQHWLVCVALASLSWPIAFLAKAIPVPQKSISFSNLLMKITQRDDNFLTESNI